MKFIAHRGASLICQEDTLKSLNKGAELGAYAVECDLRLTKDDVFVFFHDDDLKRLANDQRLIKDITYAEMKEALEKAGLELTTLQELTEGYNGNSYVLFDSANCSSSKSSAKKYNIDDSFLKMVKKLPFKVILGVHDVTEAENASKYFPHEQILAFMKDKNKYEEYYKAGAGNIRLWENWLCDIKPMDIKAKCPNAEVWIMSNDSKTGMNGNINSLEFFTKSGVDGVLLNDIQLATYWQKTV